jgi:hypothetical protein
MQHNGWDHALKVTADGTGLVGHAGAVLLWKAADQAGLTALLSGALRKAGRHRFSASAFDADGILAVRYPAWTGCKHRSGGGRDFRGVGWGAG